VGYPPQGYAPQPQKESHVLRTVLIVLGILLVLGCGGCFAVVGLGLNAADDAVKKSQANDNLRGGPNNPIDVEVGQPFTINGMEFQPGWRLANGPAGTTVEQLSVKHNREGDNTVVEFITITFYRGDNVLGEATCASEPVRFGKTIGVTCTPTQNVRRYDRITANDTI
jgi:hypothetical protein